MSSFLYRLVIEEQSDSTFSNIIRKLVQTKKITFSTLVKQILQSQKHCNGFTK